MKIKRLYEKRTEIMITRFKIFEHTYQESDAEDLVNQFDEGFIDDYFRENYGVDAEEIAKYVDIWYYVDDDRFVEDWIDSEIQSFTIRDISDEYKMREYIKDNLIDNDSVEKFLKKKRKELNLSKTNSYEDILKELDDDDLQELIENEDKDEEFIEWYVKDRYQNMSAQDILSELYGERDLRENGYKYVENYVDLNKVEDDYYDNESYDYKSEWVRDRIEYERDLQNKLMEINPKNSILLLDVISPDDKTIGDEYEFQMALMDEAIRLVKEEDYDEDYPAKQMKKLNDKFGLADGIEDEYKDYTFYIDMEKYNL